MKKITRVLIYTFVTCVSVLLLTGVAYHERILRLHAASTLFEEDKIVTNFSSMEEAFLTAKVKRSGDVFEYRTEYQDLPEVFHYKDEEVDTSEFITRRSTTALLVVKDDKITFEEYYQGTNEDDLRISWSVGKSVISTLFGIAVGDGLINIEDDVTKYLPALRGSGYEGVSIKSVLQMSSGIKWNEDYSDPNSDINKMSWVLSVSGSLDEFATTLKRERESGVKWHYVSMDTHILSMVLRAATGLPVNQYMEQRLWSKIGAESDGYWITDNEGNAFALGGLNLKTRDYARIGRLWVNRGKIDGEQLIPPQWEKASHTPDSPHISGSDKIFGYGYQWWLGPDARQGEFLAIGVYGQYIYINQPQNVVIVKNSADLDFMDERGSMWETVSFFRAVTDSLSDANVSPL